MTTTENPHALPTGYQLQDYRLLSIIGHGGFGITYLAKDTKLNNEVAIKEYFPNDLAIREPGYNVQPKSQQDKENFAWGLERFLQEGQTLATFQHPNIVRVLRYFEAHNTAYIVMEYEQGQSLSSAIKNNKSTTTEAFLLEILSPLLEGLQAVHEAGLLHRDIKPDNIYLRDKDHSPVLLDFGAARYAIGSRSRSVTTIVTPGYTPFEQYQTKGDQGPWTDIYALGAVLYRVISQKIPVEAPKRVNAIKLREEPDPLPPATKIGRKHYSARLLRCIDWALEVAEKDRPQTVSEWAEALLPPPSPTEQAKPAEPIKRIKWPIYVGVIVAITLTLGYMIYTSLRLAQLQHRVEEVQRQLEEANDDQQQLAELLLKQATLQKALSEIQRQVYLASKARQLDQQRLTQLQLEQAALQQALSKVQRQLGDVDAKIHGTIFHDYLQDNSLGPEMVWIPAGRFQMGDIQGQGDNDEQPMRWVSVEKFAIGRTEVTFAEYDRFAEATGREKPDDNGWGRGNRPVINVSMADATAYAAWLSQQTKQQYRLPTEAQWEYAARAGTETLYWWGNEIGLNRANCDGCGSQWDNQKTAPVGSFAPNPFGLYDTVGNVWEWTCSEYQEKYYGKEQDCATIPNITTVHVERGGSLYNYPKALRAANRYKKPYEYRNPSVGFRLSRTEEPKL
jgi:formylglycine-generating enzyme required for sulfatase activity/serine/threonine protein kinase